MTHCNLQLEWKRLEIMRNKTFMHGPFYFTVGIDAFRFIEKKEARAWPIVIYSWTGRFHKSS